MFAAAIAILVGLAQPGAHPNSIASLHVTLDGNTAWILFDTQAETLLETRAWGLDLDKDGALRSYEVDDAWDLLTDQLPRGMRLTLDGQNAPIQFDRFVSDPPASDGLPLGHVIFHGEAACEATPRTLAFDYDLFFVDNPDHRVLVTIVGPRGKTSRLLDQSRPSFELSKLSDLLPEPRSRMLRRFVKYGFHHVIRGWDHLAFLLALMLGVIGWRRLLGAVTAFTLAHSATLAMSTLGWLRLAPGPIEAAIAASIVWVAWRHAKLPAERRHPWRPAAALGLLHGLGFAGALGPLLAERDQLTMPLLGFNLGVELGQIVVFVPVLLLAVPTRHLLGPERTERLRQVIAFLLVMFGLYLLGTRLPSLLQ